MDRATPLHSQVTGRHDERGAALSLLLLGTVVLVMLSAGLIVDGGRKYDAAAQAQAAAAAAARAGSDAAAKQAIAGAPVDAGVAVSAAQLYLAQAGVQGTVSVDGTSVVVTATQRRATDFLSMVGIDQVSASATATSQLFNPATVR